MWLYYFLALALIIAFHNGMVDAQEGGVRTRYTDAMRNLMASSHDRVNNTQGEEKDTGDEGDDDESDENEGDFSNEKEQEDDSDDAEATETSTN
ncbi:hypothetical protein GCK32_002298 [Trichostrongylus colubriformis]|uniref:Secreted protein n=1 Tax=Trichostrongylus colubriformis TaxID=6319 RepID=A0AAN8IEF0_TRICO